MEAERCEKEYRLIKKKYVGKHRVLIILFVF